MKMVSQWVCCAYIGLACLESYAAEWETKAELSAPEAKQAAAADENFVYAITNKSIAKYERSSGKRVAESSGEAEHLNSGFFWKGKLLCAHSNYPALPEKSEIKILDTKSMQLGDFRDFGNFGGSLTWVVWHADHWWCNFACYGTKNDRTFLVRFNEQWEEVDRWTYPKSLIDQLGRYSLSGGLWYEGELLVTGHDKQEIYRLRLPHKGKELVYIGKEAIAFTGQGIALDPLSGGLVGISRAEKR